MNLFWILMKNILFPFLLIVIFFENLLTSFVIKTLKKMDEQILISMNFFGKSINKFVIWWTFWNLKNILKFEEQNLTFDEHCLNPMNKNWIHFFYLWWTFFEFDERKTVHEFKKKIHKKVKSKKVRDFKKNCSCILKKLFMISKKLFSIIKNVHEV